MYFSNNFNFPKQRVSAAERNKFEYYANCCDYVIAAGKSIARDDEVEQKYAFLKGEINPEFYKKIVKDDTVRRKYTGYSFENGNMIQHSGPYTSLFREILTIRKAKPYNTQYSGIYAPATKR